MANNRIGILVFTLILGLAAGGLIKIGVAEAQSQTPAASSGGHVGANGVKEELLTGSNADKARAAALAAVPGGTVERVETDAEGSPYEAHMLKADGSRVTVKFDSSFNVDHIEDGYQQKSRQ